MNKHLGFAGGSLSNQVHVTQNSRKWMVLSSVLSGRQSAGMFITLLLIAGLIGVFASPGVRRGTAFPASSGQKAALDRAAVHSDSPQAARDIALAYYAKKYGDRDVSVEVRSGGNHSEEALIRKNGFLVKKLSIRGNTVIEEHTGLHNWIFDLLTNVN